MYNVDLFYSKKNSNILYRRNMTLKADTDEEVNTNLSVLFRTFDYEVIKMYKIN